MASLVALPRPAPASKVSHLWDGLEATVPTPSASLLFDCELEGEECRPEGLPRGRSAYLASICDRLAVLTTPVGEFMTQLLRDVVAYTWSVLEEESGPDIVVLATKLANVGYMVTVRTAIGGGQACFRNLRHEFLSVEGAGDCQGLEFVVDPEFKQHFEIPHPSPLYQEILSSLPQAFVGTPGKLAPLVQLLCAEMANSFDVRGLTLPPWRRSKSMLTKWLPVKSRDVCLSRETNGGLIASNWSLVPRPEASSSSSTHAKVNASLLSKKLLNRAGPSVVVKPPIYWGQPPTYCVKMDSVASQS